MTALALNDRPSPRRARDFDVAWSKHLGRPLDRVPEWAQREVRNLKRSLEPTAKALDAAARDQNRWSGPIGDYFYKKTEVGRARAFKKLAAVFRGARIVRQGEALVVSWLAPSGPLTTANDYGFGFKQDAVVQRGLSIICTRDAAISISLTGLEAPDHCLGRLYERAPRVDAARVLHGAANAFLAMDFRQALGLGRGTLILPADGGVFLSNLVLGRRKRGGWSCYARPRTFVSSDLADGAQAPLPPASDVERSVLVAGWGLSGKLPGLPSPLSAAEAEALESEFEQARA